MPRTLSRFDLNFMKRGLITRNSGGTAEVVACPEINPDVRFRQPVEISIGTVPEFLGSVDEFAMHIEPGTKNVSGDFERHDCSTISSTQCRFVVLQTYCFLPLFTTPSCYERSGALKSKSIFRFCHFCKCFASCTTLNSLTWFPRGSSGWFLRFGEELLRDRDQKGVFPKSWNWEGEDAAAWNEFCESVKRVDEKSL